RGFQAGRESRGHRCCAERGRRFPWPSPAAAETDAIPAGEIAPTPYARVARARKQFRYRCRLVVTVLEEQPAAGNEQRRRSCHDFPYGIQPVGAGNKRAFRLETHI